MFNPDKVYNNVRVIEYNELDGIFDKSGWMLPNNQNLLDSRTDYNKKDENGEYVRIDEFSSLFMYAGTDGEYRNGMYINRIYDATKPATEEEIIAFYKWWTTCEDDYENWREWYDIEEKADPKQTFFKLLAMCGHIPFGNYIFEIWW
jgi:hypothetical protein